MISVLIATSPGRESFLKLCLQALARQITAPAFEVIVCDDGSDGMQSSLEPFEGVFQGLTYDWRPNDHNLSRSRNRAAALAQGDSLIFLNTDILFNPLAIAAYSNYLQSYPDAVCWGYVGCRKEHTAPSLWFPEVLVNWLDFRFFPVNANQLFLNPDLQRAPHTLASGHHFALNRQTFEKIGPLNESFQAWGEEDVEFALRALLKNHPMLFVGDPWAEHLAHDYSEDFHSQAKQHLRKKLECIVELENQITPQKIRSAVLFGNEQANLNRHIQQHYLSYSPTALQQEMAFNPFQ